MKVLEQATAEKTLVQDKNWLIECGSGRVRRRLLFTGFFAGLLLASGCGNDQPIAPERYLQSDSLFEQVKSNVAANSAWRGIGEIDHSRLGQQAGSVMPPSRVLIFSVPSLEVGLIEQNPLTALDLPLRVLAYEETPDGVSKVIYNDYAYIQSRYNLPEQSKLGAVYEQSIAEALQGIPEDQIGSFHPSDLEEGGITTINSPFDFAETLQRINDAIASQDDTVDFGVVDFQEQAEEQGIELLPNTLILFGAPAPGAKAMTEAPTLGLDAFCQKFLVWQDSSGNVKLSFNDLLALAERQGVGASIPLRVISYRLNKVFSEALAK
ncbi:MAG: DUF302 domain-containing protein [Halioglobus sp.]